MAAQARPSLDPATTGRQAAGRSAADVSSAPADAAPILPSDDPAVARAVRGVVEALVHAGTVSAAGVVDALEGAGRALSRRVVAGAVRRPGLGGRDELARALAEAPRGPVVAGTASAALAVGCARRLKRLGFLAKRSPAWLLATAVPTLAASVTRGADELGMVAAHLVERARAANVEPDLERVRRTAVQLLTHRPVDPEVEPGHGRLVVAWARRAARATLPFSAGVTTADPEGLAAAAAAVDPALLGPA